MWCNWKLKCEYEYVFFVVRFVKRGRVYEEECDIYFFYERGFVRIVNWFFFVFFSFKN